MKGDLLDNSSDGKSKDKMPTSVELSTRIQRMIADPDEWSRLPDHTRDW